MARVRVGVIGHVEHITIGRVPRVPRAGDIAHLEDVTWFPGGGGGIAFYQLVKSDAEVHLFSAVGNDEAGRAVGDHVANTGAHVHLAHRNTPHTRDVVMIDEAGERTIVVVGAPLHPHIEDPLPWGLLDEMDAVYFTGQDHRVLSRARGARILLATARRRRVIDEARVPLDVVVGSRHDPREQGSRSDYLSPPGAMVMTLGSEGGEVETAEGIVRYDPTPAPPEARGGAYGAGDSFAGALSYYVATGASALEGAGRAARAGAAVLGSLNTLEAQIWLR